MSASRTKFYLDKQDGKILGVCAGIANYTGIDPLLVRIGTVFLTIIGGFPWTVIAYFLTAWLAPNQPVGLYTDPEDEKFWQRFRANPKRSTADVRSKFRDIDRRLADIEQMYVSRNSTLSSEIDRLR